jgi:hypothetical protein
MAMKGREIRNEVLEQLLPMLYRGCFVTPCNQIMKKSKHNNHRNAFSIHFILSF